MTDGRTSSKSYRRLGNARGRSASHATSLGARSLGWSCPEGAGAASWPADPRTPSETHAGKRREGTAGPTRPLGLLIGRALSGLLVPNYLVPRARRGGACLPEKRPSPGLSQPVPRPPERRQAGACPLDDRGLVRRRWLSELVALGRGRLLAGGCAGERMAAKGEALNGKQAGPAGWRLPCCGFALNIP